MVSAHTALLLHTEVQCYLEEMHWCDCLRCQLNQLLFHGTLFLLERMTDRQIVVTQNCVFGRHFLDR